MKKGVPKNFLNFIGKRLCWSLFLIKLQRLRRRCFPMNTAKFLKTPISKNICERLLLHKQPSLLVYNSLTYLQANLIVLASHLKKNAFEKRPRHI